MRSNQADTRGPNQQAYEHIFLKYNMKKKPLILGTGTYNEC